MGNTYTNTNIYTYFKNSILMCFVYGWVAQQGGGQGKLAIFVFVFLFPFCLSTTTAQ